MKKSASSNGLKVIFGKQLNQLPPPKSSSNTSTFSYKMESGLPLSLVLIELPILSFSLMIPKVKTLISAKEEEPWPVALKNLWDFKMSGRKWKLDSQFSTLNWMQMTKCIWLLIIETSSKDRLRWSDLKGPTTGLKKNMVRVFNHSRPLYG